MIAEFGLFKRAEETASNIVYVDPQYLHNSSYKRDLKSDIYSLSILLWELSSGRPPFFNQEDQMIATEIVNGKREDPIEDTPPEYLRLYQKCWQGDPNLRSGINEVYGILSRLQFKTNERINAQIAYDENYLDLEYNEPYQPPHDTSPMDSDYNEMHDQSSLRISEINQFNTNTQDLGMGKFEMESTPSHS